MDSVLEGEIQQKTSEQSSEIRPISKESDPTFLEALVTRYFPAPTNQISIVGSSNRRQESSKYEQRKYERQKNGVVQSVKENKIPHEIMFRYIECLYETLTLLSPKEETSLPDFRELIALAPSYEAALHAKVYAQKWREEIDLPEKEITYTEYFFDIFRALGNEGSMQENNEERDVLFEESISAFKSVSRYEDGLLKRFFLSNIASIIAKEKSIGQLPIYTHLFQQMMLQVPTVSDKEPFRVFLFSIGEYMQMHYLNSGDENILISHLLPDIIQLANKTNILYTNADLENSHRGDIDEGNFIIETYISPVTPVALAKLISESRNLAIMGNHNRIINDAIRITEVFPELRHLIHRNKRAILGLSEAVVTYYTDHNDVDLKSRLELLVGKDQGNSLFDELVDLQVYEKPINNTDKTPVIDVLYSILNTSGELVFNPPIVDNVEIDKLVKDVDSPTSSFEDIGEICSKLSKILIAKMETGEKGIDPSMILLLSWVDNISAEFLHTLSYEESRGVYKSAWFQSILQFHELIATGSSYNHIAFQQWQNKVIATQDNDQAYHLMQMHVLDTTMKLKDEFYASGISDQVKYLWSGTISGALLNLAQESKAKTQVGKKLQQEDKIRITEPGFHPGD